MIDAADLRDWLAAVGLAESEVPALIASSDYSRARLAAARAALENTRSHAIPLALGSFARHEACALSDLDVAFVHDGDATLASSDRQVCLQALRARGFDVPEKTFRRSVPFEDLAAAIGGPSDTHESLTHRALVLTEGAWLRDEAATRAAWDRLFDLYRTGATSGRWMTLLMNDLHRYYRTVCLDYRHKIEAEAKGWAPRYLKLRCTRKTLHLANLTVHCAARATGGEDGHDAWLRDHLSLPPVARIAASLAAIGRGPEAADLWREMDAFLAGFSDRDVREELDRLVAGAEKDSRAFQRMRGVASRLETAAERVVQALLDDSRTRRHLLRFGLL